MTKIKIDRAPRVEKKIKMTCSPQWHNDQGVVREKFLMAGQSYPHPQRFSGPLNFYHEVKE